MIELREQAEAIATLEAVSTQTVAQIKSLVRAFELPILGNKAALSRSQSFPREIAWVLLRGGAERPVPTFVIRPVVRFRAINDTVPVLSLHRLGSLSEL
jgi:hypothetical protein